MSLEEFFDVVEGKGPRLRWGLRTGAFPGRFSSVQTPPEQTLPLMIGSCLSLLYPKTLAPLFTK